MEHTFIDMSKLKWVPESWMQLDRTYDSYRAMKLIVTFKPRSEHQKCSIVILDRDMKMKDRSWYMRDHRMYESFDHGKTWKEIWKDDVSDIFEIVDRINDKPDIKHIWMNTVVDQYKCYSRGNADGKYELEVVRRSCK